MFVSAADKFKPNNTIKAFHTEIPAVPQPTQVGIV
jgi:hypothetical protein